MDNALVVPFGRRRALPVADSVATAQSPAIFELEAVNLSFRAMNGVGIAR
jgi:hypothetical protein